MSSSGAATACGLMLATLAACTPVGAPGGVAREPTRELPSATPVSTTTPPATVADPVTEMPPTTPALSATRAALPSPRPGEPPTLGSLLPRFGINYVYHSLDEYLKRGGANPEAYIAQQHEKLLELGVGWIRSAGQGDQTSLNWGNVEPQDGVFHFALHDLRVQDAQARGLRTLGNVDFTNVPRYAQSPGVYFDDGEYLEYLNAIVERYDGDGVDDMPGLQAPVLYWEIGNEVVVKKHFRGSADEYAHVLQISRTALRATCPDCVLVIGGWIIGKDDEDGWERSIDYFERVLAAGAGDAFDIMNYHEYSLEYERLTYEHVGGFREVLARYGLDKPIWITEANTRPDLETGVTVEQQAQDVVKRPVVAFAAGVDVFMWHGLDDVRGGPSVGLFDQDGVPKPAYYNLKLLISSVDGFTTVERIDLGSDALHVYRFAVDDGLVGVLWSEAGDTTVDLSGCFGSEDLRLENAITTAGETVHRSSVVDVTSVPVSETPVIVRAE